MNWIWIIFCGFIAMLIEINLSSMGIYFPIIATVAFYFTMTYGWEYSYPCMLAFGTMLDLYLARPVPTFFVILPAINYLAFVWKKHSDCKKIGPQAVAGAIIGIVAAIIPILAQALYIHKLNLNIAIHYLYLIIMATIITSAIFPIIIIFLDLIASQLNLYQYQNIQLREEVDYV